MCTSEKFNIKLNTEVRGMLATGSTLKHSGGVGGASADSKHF